KVSVAETKHKKHDRRIRQLGQENTQCRSAPMLRTRSWIAVEIIESSPRPYGTRSPVAVFRKRCTPTQRLPSRHGLVISLFFVRSVAGNRRFLRQRRVP